MSQAELNPSHIMQVGMGFWPSKTLLSAVELELFTDLGAGVDDRRASSANARPAPARDRRLLRHARGAALSRARRRRADGALSQHAETRGVPRQAAARPTSAASSRWQRAAVSVLGRSDRGAADRRSRRTRSSTPARRCSRSSTATPRGSSSSWARWRGISAGNFQALAEKFDFSTLQDALRRRRRHRPALDARRRAPSAPALHQLRSAGRRADREQADRGRRAVATA